MTSNIVLMIAVSWAAIGLVPLAKWRFAGTRRLRHVEGSRGYLRDVYLANVPILPLLPMIVTLSALAAADVIGGTEASVLMIVVALAVTFGVSVPVVKRASIRLLRTRYPDEAALDGEACV